MSKANRPHPETFLAFALRVEEFLGPIESSWPTWGEDRLPRRESLLDRRIHARILQRRENSIAVFTAVEKSRLVDAGVTERQLTSENMQEYIGEQAARLQSIYEMEASSRPDFVSGYKAADGEPSYARQSIRLVILGAHLAFGDGQRVQTERFLNRGLPRGDTGINYLGVRNAVDGFLTQFLRNQRTDFANLDICAALCTAQAKALDFIWRECGGASKASSAEVRARLREMMSSGALIEIYSHALERVFVWPLDRQRSDELLQRSIYLLKRKLGKQTAAAKKEGLTPA